MLFLLCHTVSKVDGCFDKRSFGRGHSKLREQDKQRGGGGKTARCVLEPGN